ncbi:MAG: marine proteobacterial sortase target protein [Candidatus Rifleibacteriota bacterium]
MTTERCALLNPKSGTEIPLEYLAIHGDMVGLNCSWQMTQKFKNREKEAIEAVFSFPLPSDGILSELIIKTGEKTIEAKPEEKEAAFEKYDEAIQEGNGAFLLDQERPNFFVISVGNLLPDQEVEIKIGFFQLLDSTRNTVRVAFPIALVPKYVPEKNSREAIEWERVEPDFVTKVPYKFKFNLRIVQNSPIKVIESPSHPVSITNETDATLITLAHKEATPDKDVIINIELKENFKPTLSSTEFSGNQHLLFEVIPEFTYSTESTAKKEIIFVIDCSGSMAGNSIQEAKNAVQLCLRSLNEEDLFQIIKFGSTWSTLFPKPMKFNQESLERASAEIATIDADMGGTEILPALDAAIKSARLEFSNILLFTDGAVSNEKDVINLAKAKKGRCRIFSFGIGNGASEYLVKGVAENSGGKAEFIFPGERIEPKVLRQFARLNSPMLSNLKIDWQIDDVEVAPSRIPAIFAGEIVRSSAKLKPGTRVPENLKVTLHGYCGNEHLSWVSSKPEKVKNNVPALWWAGSKISELENYTNENQPGSKRKEKKQDNIDAQIIKLSKEYGIICSKTSLIGIETRSEAEKNDGNVVLRKIPAMVPDYRQFMAEAIHPPIYSKGLLNIGAVACVSTSSHRNLPPTFRTRGDLSSQKASIQLPTFELKEKVFSFAEPPEPECFVNEADDFEKSLTNEDKLMKILMLIKANGSFAYEKSLLSLLGSDDEEFNSMLSKAPTYLSSELKKDYAMTMLVKEKLEINFAEFRDIWLAISAKMEKWLNKFQKSGSA